MVGVVDGGFSVTLSVAFYDSTALALFQRVASTVIGGSAFEGGWATALLGLGMHFGVAFGWSAVVLGFIFSSVRIRRLLDRRRGVVAASMVVGLLIWLVMSLIVIPVLTGAPATITGRWWVQLVGHVPFVGLPLVASLAPSRRTGEA
jgi:hypothetical protein